MSGFILECEIVQKHALWVGRVRFYRKCKILMAGFDIKQYSYLYIDLFFMKLNHPISIMK